ncbi:MAG TPA: divalent metal cation transporter [Chthoniobacterales bacterium]
MFWFIRWRTGLARKPNEAVGFYGVLSAATICGLGLTLTSFDPIRALFWSAVINGPVAVPILVLMMLMATNQRVMGRFTISGGLRLVGWVAAGVMALTAVGLFVPLGN